MPSKANGVATTPKGVAVKKPAKKRAAPKKYNTPLMLREFAEANHGQVFATVHSSNGGKPEFHKYNTREDAKTTLENDWDCGSEKFVSGIAIYQLVGFEARVKKVEKVVEQVEKENVTSAFEAI